MQQYGSIRVSPVTEVSVVVFFRHCPMLTWPPKLELSHLRPPRRNRKVDRRLKMGLSENDIAIRDLEAEIDVINATMQDLSNKRRSLQTQRNRKLPFFNLDPKICVVTFSFACHKGRLSLRNGQLVTTPLVISSRTWEIHVKCLIPKSRNLAIFVRTDSPKFCPHRGSGLAFAQILSAHWIRHLIGSIQIFPLRGYPRHLQRLHVNYNLE